MPKIRGMNDSKQSIIRKGIALAILAAALYALSTPFSKILLDDFGSAIQAGLLYIGAGLGMLAIMAVRKIRARPVFDNPLDKSDVPYAIAMIVLDIAAPIFLMMGLKSTAAANASLLNNFEIPATALIAALFFHEAISKRTWKGIILVVLSCLILSVSDASSFQFSYGSLLILAAACCWGIENNCTRKLSDKDPLEIVLLKGIFSGGGSLIIGLCLQQEAVWSAAIWVLILGFLAYGLSIYFYVLAQRYVGAARTSACYAIAPFIGALLSFILFHELPGINFLIALALMAAGVWFCSE